MSGKFLKVTGTKPWKTYLGYFLGDFHFVFLVFLLRISFVVVLALLCGGVCRRRQVRVLARVPVHELTRRRVVVILQIPTPVSHSLST